MRQTDKKCIETSISERCAKDWRGAICSARPQLILLGVIGVLHLVSATGLIPSPSALNSILKEAFVRHGVPLVALCSFFENLAMVNGYFPGAFTILAGMASTAGDPARAVAMYFAIYVPALTANIASYWIGKASSTKNRTEIVQSSTVFWATYWHPQLASVTAFDCGSSARLGFGRFVARSLPASLTWSLFWAYFLYHSGMIADISGYFWSGFICYLAVWALVRIVRFWRC
jgi:membrane protein DedA with SNARE-associated domain